MSWNNTEYFAGYGTGAQLPAYTLPEIAFAGHSNVGKSSIINKLCDRTKLARVSSEPGKTSTINFYNCSDTFFISDLPGYGFAKVSQKERARWAELMESYLNSEREGPDIVVLLIDMRHEPTKEDVAMVNFLIDSQTPFIIVLTKADKLRPTARKKRMEAFMTEIPEAESIKIIPFSCVTGEGKEEVRETLLDAVGIEDKF